MSKSITSKQPSGSGRSSLQLMPGIGMVDLSHPELSGRLAEIAIAQLATFQATVRQGLLAASVQIGLGVMQELMAAEVDQIVGPKGRHQPARTASRHGQEAGSVPDGVFRCAAPGCVRWTAAGRSGWKRGTASSRSICSPNGR